MQQLYAVKTVIALKKGGLLSYSFTLLLVLLPHPHPPENKASHVYLKALLVKI